MLDEIGVAEIHGEQFVQLGEMYFQIQTEAIWHKIALLCCCASGI
jgi:hypothetical protein